MTSPRMRHGFAIALLATVLSTPAIANDINFESPPVHPIELSPNGQNLFVAHTADHRLVVYHLTGAQPYRLAEIMVGIEPVTVRARSDNEVWVVNHVSNDISIVDLSTRNVVRTLLVGSEPTDVVFANGRAFVCLSQEDLIRAYDLSNLDNPPVEIPLDTSEPRSLALSPDGNTLYITAMEGGNHTTVIPFQTVEALGGPPAPSPPMSGSLPAPPRPSLIVRHDGSNWLDDSGGNWDAAVPYVLADQDVVAVSTNSLSVVGTFQDVGTTMFNVAVHPTTGDLYVSNQEAFNDIRFEPNLSGRFVHNRVSIVTSGGTVTPRHLNEHIDYGNPAGSASERAMSLSIPLDIVMSGDGATLYLAAFGSGKVGVLDAGGNVLRRIPVAGGPAGLALDEARNVLYVYNRFPSTVSVVDLNDDSSLELSLGFDPTPPNVKDGRKFLYDGALSSAHGDLSCASCHLFGNMDNIAWDLGDPQGSMKPVPPGQLAILPDFHPMKGPMTTQTLRGLQGTGPFHWRGDNNQLVDFNPAFVSLLGRSSPLGAGDFQLFEDFVFSIQYPANPFQELDGSMPASLNGANPSNGATLFSNGNLVGGVQCSDCHALPTGENGAIIPGNLLNEDEAKVVPQLRNMYEKTRFDGQSAVSVRGYGFTHDGAVPTLFEFLQFPAFTFNNDNDRHDVAAFLLAFDTGTPPALGVQWTMDGTNEAQGIGRVNTLVAEADLGRIGLVAKGRVAAQPRGWTYLGGGSWRPDKQAEPDVNLSSLLGLAGAGSEVTFTGVAAGCESRLGIDRDLDGFRDGDELDAGSDPGDAGSTPDNVPTGLHDITSRTPTGLWMAGANPVVSNARLRFQVGDSGPVRLEIFDVRGRLVRRIVAESNHPRGTFVRAWDLRNGSGKTVSSGVYFARLQTRDAIRVQRMTIVR